MAGQLSAFARRSAKAAVSFRRATSQAGELELHIGQACVDLLGNLVCDGTLEFPRDDDGKFERMVSTQVVVGRDWMTIANCRSTRHASGFLESISEGPVLSMPRSLVALVNEALQFGVKQTVKANIDGQHGFLFSSSSMLHRYIQPLSDWQLEISERSGHVDVRVSATLFAAHIRDWSSEEDNFWQARPKISARFSVDPLTRSASYYSYIPELDVHGAASASTVSLPASDSLDLATATVGLSNDFGRDGEKWINVGFDRSSSQGDYLTFTEHSGVHRLANGYLSRGDYVWPRVWFYGVHLQSLTGLDERSIRFSGSGLRARADASGHGDSWTEDATDAFLDVCLNQRGLEMIYSLTTAKRRLDRAVILPWETLLLRLPKLGSRWSKFRKVTSEKDRA